MLERATSLKKVSFYCLRHFLLPLTRLQIVDLFVVALVSAETDRNKRQKLNDLQLSEEEWTRVESFLDLLAVSSSFLFLTDSLIFSTARR